MSTTATPGLEAPPPSDVEAGIDALVGNDTPLGVDSAPAPESAPAATPAAAPVATPAATPATAPAATPASTPATEPSKLGEDLEKLIAKPAATEPEPTTPKALREAYAATKAEIAKRDAELAKLRTSQDEVKREAAEAARAELKAELESLKTKLNEREEAIRLTDYTKSYEYKEQFAKPIAEAWERVAEDITGVKITRDDGTEVDASVNDIASLCRMSKRDAIDAAEKFGKYARLALDHRDRIVDLANRAQKAVTDWKGKAQSLEQQATTTRQEIHRRFETETSALRSDPNLKPVIGVDDTDAEAKDLLAKGDTLVRTALIGDNLPEGTTPDKAFEMRFNAQKLVAVRAAAFAPTYLKLTRANAKIAELEAKLKSYDNSEPPVGGDHGDSVPVTPRTGADGIDDLPGMDMP